MNGGCKMKSKYVITGLILTSLLVGCNDENVPVHKHELRQHEKIVYEVPKPKVEVLNEYTVLVDKDHKLPDGYVPKDLVFANIPFLDGRGTEKTEMTKEASAMIEKMFLDAKNQGINLLGVSAYRSYKRQIELFNYYVKKDGYEKASMYSAIPGTSEHQTGLAIDVTGGNGKCAADDCFGGTPEAQWLQNNVANYGFIIRYPQGKESVTGYKYEPWHLRYVGTNAAKDIMQNNLTLEEYISKNVAKY
jgi:D-alanyl-D-alanine carboxypeptidase